MPRTRAPPQASSRPQNPDQLIEARKKFNDTPDILGATSLIAAYGQGNSLDNAYDVFHALRSAKIKPNVAVFRTLLTACNKTWKPRKGVQLIDEMINSNVAFDSVCFGILSKFCAETRDVVAGAKLLDSWSLSSSPSSRAKGDAVSALHLIKTFTGNHDLDRAFQVFDVLCRDATPAPRVYASLINACIKAKQHSRALPLWDHMKTKGFDPIGDDALFGCFACVCEATGHLETTRVLIDALLVDRQPYSNPSLYCAQLLMALVKAERINEALNTFEKMGAKGLPVGSPQSYVILFTACAETVMLRRGKRLHDRLSQSGYPWWKDVILGTAIINMYGRCGAAREARAAFDTMREAGTAINVATWNAMAYAYTACGMADETLVLFNEMVTIAPRDNEGVRPDEVTFACVLTACSHRSKVDEALTLLRAMEGLYGVRPTLIHYNVVVDALCRAGRGEEAEALLEAMTTQHNIVPDLVTYISLLGACRFFADADRVKQLLPRALPFAKSDDPKGT